MIIIVDEVREMASAFPVRISPPTASTILFYTPTNSWKSNTHAQHHPSSSGIPHGVSHLTRKGQRCHAYKFHKQRCSGSPILEQTTGWDSHRIVGEILQDTPGRQLAVRISQSTHLALFLSQPTPPAHSDPRKKSTPKLPFPHTATTPLNRL